MQNWNLIFCNVSYMHYIVSGFKDYFDQKLHFNNDSYKK